MFEILSAWKDGASVLFFKLSLDNITTYARTFEKSEDGDMTKLSFELDQDIKC